MFYDLYDQDDEDLIDTIPPAAASFEVMDECEALFTSAEWIVRARVNGEIYWESKPYKQAHTPGFVKAWARSCLRQNEKELKQLGVDVEAAYVLQGGVAADLKK